MTIDGNQAVIEADPRLTGYSIQREAPPITDRHRPGHFYTSAETFEREKTEIFYKDWLNVGRVEEIPEPGDYLTARICDEPIILVRNKAKEIVALANVCAHRGVAVASGEGKTKFFTCPYHGWVYDLDGRLRDAQFIDGPNFDKSRCRLPAIRVETWAGFIFVNFDNSAPTLREALGETVEIYEPYQMQRLRLGAKTKFELGVNWKLVTENLADIYHVAVLHADTFGPHQPLSGYRALDSKTGFHAYFKGGTLTPDGKSAFGRGMPWLPESLLEGGYTSYIPPNVSFFPRCDHVSYVTTWPIAEDKCELVVHTLFPEEFQEDPDFERKVEVYTEFGKAILAEDLDMIHSLQRGLKSRFYGRGPMSPFEVVVQASITHSIDRL